ncbi:MAG: hypothetical protein C5B47_01015 [Verrucomicrobia bacterium]|nr:MAG: hypothetical protein C5B47_01015 [Verrucomicrobiota bacterium]
MPVTTTTHASDVAQVPPRSPKKPFNPKILYATLILMGIIGTGVYFSGRNTETTDDAFIATHIVQIAPRIAGQILRVWVNDNQFVKKGDLLVELDPRDNQALYAQAAAYLASSEAKLLQSRFSLLSSQRNLDQCSADVTQAQANVENSDADFIRNEDLRNRGVISQRDYDASKALKLGNHAILEGRQKKVLGARSDVQMAEASVKSAQATVEEARALLESARLRVLYTKIYASQDGYITHKNAEPGNYISSGTQLMALVSDKVWVVANFKETQLRRIRKGQDVDIHVDAYPNLKLKGKVDSIQAGSGSQFSLLPPENATGNFVKVVQRIPVKIILTNLSPLNAPLLGPGMSVRPTVFIHFNNK